MFSDLPRIGFHQAWPGTEQRYDRLFAIILRELLAVHRRIDEVPGIRESVSKRQIFFVPAGWREPR